MNKYSKIIISSSWDKLILPKLGEYMDYLGKELYKEYRDKTIYPPKEEIFTAFRLTSYENTTVVFLGLDPYTKKGQAYGVSFGVKESCKNIPPSLINIFKEIESDVYNGLMLDKDYSLKSWCDQGCLMLNTALTVEENKTGSHLKLWDRFTKAVFEVLNEKDFLIFVLLGKKAQEYSKYIKNSPDFHIIKTAHPAAEAYSGNKAGFFNSKIFSKINRILINNNKSEIKW